MICKSAARASVYCILALLFSVTAMAQNVSPCAGFQVPNTPITSGSPSFESLGDLSAQNLNVNTNGFGAPTGTATVTFRATGRICLGAGFQAAATGSGGTFHAVIVLAQTISFGVLPDQSLETATFNLSATASSGLTVSFSSTTTNVCTVSGNVVSLVSAGSCSITASQGGNSNYAAASSVLRSFSVSTEPTSITVSAAPSPSVFADYMTLTATVTPAISSEGVSVFFCDADAVMGPCNSTHSLANAELFSGVATTQYLATLGAGTHHLKATFQGDATHSSSTSALWAQHITPATPQVTIDVPGHTEVPVFVGYGLPVTLHASVTPSVATGTITFVAGDDSEIGTAALNNGAASFTASAIPMNTSTILARYSGDTNDQPADSAGISISVRPSVHLIDLTQSHTDLTQGGTAWAGDSFELTIYGPPNQTVDVDESSSNNRSTNQYGIFTGFGTWSAQPVGAQFQHWKVGGIDALPSPLAFTVNSSSQTTVELVDVTLNKSYQDGQTAYNAGDSFQLAVYGAPNSPVTYSVNGAGFTAAACGGNGNTDPSGLCLVTGTFPGGGGSYSEIWKVGTAVASPTLAFSLTGSGNPSITAATLPGGTIGVGYTASIAVTGGTSPYTWTTYSGSLPPGLSLSAAPPGGLASISGTPSASGQFAFSLQVRDNAGNVSTTQPFSIAISSLDKPYITTTSLPPGSIGVQYSSALTAAGGSGVPYTWSYTGSLPAGLSLPSGGTLSGVPAESGDHTFSVTVHDSSGAASDPRSFTVSVPSFSEYIRMGGRVLAIEHR